MLVLAKKQVPMITLYGRSQGFCLQDQTGRESTTASFMSKMGIFKWNPGHLATLGLFLLGGALFGW